MLQGLKNKRTQDHNIRLSEPKGRRKYMKFKILFALLMIALNIGLFTFQDQSIYDINKSNFFPYTSMLYNLFHEPMPNFFGISTIIFFVPFLILFVMHLHENINLKNRQYLASILLILGGIALSMPPIFLFVSFGLFMGCFVGTLVLIGLKVSEGVKIDFRKASKLEIFVQVISDLNVFLLLMQCMRFLPTPLVVS